MISQNDKFFRINEAVKGYESGRVPLSRDENKYFNHLFNFRKVKGQLLWLSKGEEFLSFPQPKRAISFPCLELIKLVTSILILVLYSVHRALHSFYHGKLFSKYFKFYFSFVTCNNCSTPTPQTQFSHTAGLSFDYFSLKQQHLFNHSFF